MELFAKIVNGWKLLTIFVKDPILDIWEGSEYALIPLIHFVPLASLNTPETLGFLMFSEGIERDHFISILSSIRKEFLNNGDTCPSKW